MYNSLEVALGAGCRGNYLEYILTLLRLLPLKAFTVKAFRGLFEIQVEQGFQGNLLIS
jgi:hypothetical protein